MSVNKQFSSYVDVLRYQADQQPDKTAYIFLNDGEKEEVKITYAELDLKAKAIAARLQKQCRFGDRVILLYPSGLEFIVGFLGCLYAGVIAIPVTPPNSRMNKASSEMEKLGNIMLDAQPSAICATKNLTQLTQTIFKNDSEFKNKKWLSTDYIDIKLSEKWERPNINGDTLAFLQYTSGPTFKPRGVKANHENIIYNQEMINAAFGHTKETVVAGWLPLFHNTGLIGNIFQSMYLGVLCVFMSPIKFIRKPVRWLEAISHYKVTTSGGPNFGYDLCTSGISPKKMEGLDLSSWKVAFNGSEPVNPRTIEDFSKKFEICGFSRSSFYPSYGLSEAMLFVSGGIPSENPKTCCVNKKILNKGEIKLCDSEDKDAYNIVGCGQTRLDQKIIIVNPKTLMRQPDYTIGEILISGKNTTTGYWQRKTDDLIVTIDNDVCLRTGDLGFLIKDELFITGRLKDLIIIRGRNIYPQDIEDTVCKSHLSLRSGHCIAFSTEVAHEEKLVVIQEVKDKYVNDLDTDDIIKNIIKTISKHHELKTHTIVLIKQGTLPKTSKGKVQRNQCPTMFLEGTLDMIAMKSQKPQKPKKANISSPPKPKFESVEGIEDWLALRVSRYASVDSEIIEFSSSVFDYGLDSKQIISLNGKIEEIFGSEVSPTVFFDDPTISGIANHLADEFLVKYKK